MAMTIKEGHDVTKKLRNLRESQVTSEGEKWRRNGGVETWRTQRGEREEETEETEEERRSYIHNNNTSTRRGCKRRARDTPNLTEVSRPTSSLPSTPRYLGRYPRTTEPRPQVPFSPLHLPILLPSLPNHSPPLKIHKKSLIIRSDEEFYS